jgi:hypothetical protein
LATQTKIVFKKNPKASKKTEIKRHTSQQTQQTMTQNLNIDNSFNGKQIEGQQVTGVWLNGG